MSVERRRRSSRMVQGEFEGGTFEHGVAGGGGRPLSQPTGSRPCIRPRQRPTTTGRREAAASGSRRRVGFGGVPWAFNSGHCCCWGANSHCKFERQQ